MINQLFIISFVRKKLSLLNIKYYASERDVDETGSILVANDVHDQMLKEMLGSNCPIIGRQMFGMTAMHLFNSLQSKDPLNSVGHDSNTFFKAVIGSRDRRELSSTCPCAYLFPYQLIFSLCFDFICLI
jgi:hypothetical protein